MSTIVNIADHNIDNTPVFGQLAIGQWFMFEGDLFCKIEELKDCLDDRYNAFAPVSGFEYINLNDPVKLVEEINIQILK